jgi:DNA-3-methyladenine glycosylase I
MSPWEAALPKDDREYFERMTTHMFSAGLNWKVVESKKAGFEKAFSNFSPTEVARFSSRDVERLMNDAAIVRNEKKIQATIYNAARFLEVTKEYGSFKQYLDHFGKSEAKLQTDLQERFHQMGPSTARMFLWAVGYPLTPNREEKEWMASRKM